MIVGSCGKVDCTGCEDSQATPGEIYCAPVGSTNYAQPRKMFRRNRDQNRDTISSVQDRGSSLALVVYQPPVSGDAFINLLASGNANQNRGSSGDPALSSSVSSDQSSNASISKSSSSSNLSTPNHLSSQSSSEMNRSTAASSSSASRESEGGRSVGSFIWDMLVSCCSKEKKD